MRGDELPLTRKALEKKLFIGYIVVFFLFFDTHFQMPILAPFARSLGATPFIVGSIVSMYSLFNIIGNLISGHVIDLRSWKKPLTVGILGTTLSLYFYSLATSPYVLLMIRAFHGLAGGLVIPATMVYLTRTPTARTDVVSQRMAYYGACIGLAALTGPPAAGMMAAYHGFENTYRAIAVFLFLAAVLAIFFMKENVISERKNISFKEHYKRIKNASSLRIAFSFIFLLMGATGTLASFLPLKAESLGASPAFTGGLFAAFAATAIMVQLFWPLLVKRFNLFYFLLAGLVLLIMALVLLSCTTSLFVLFFPMALYGAAFGLLFPASLELVARGSQPSWKGLATGFFFVFFSLGVAVVPPLGGLLWQSQLHLSPFLTAAAVALFLSLSVTKKRILTTQAELKKIK